MNLFLVIIALLLIVCIDHEVRINRLENDNENEIIEGLEVLPMIWGFFGVCLLYLLFVYTWPKIKRKKHQTSDTKFAQWDTSGTPHSLYDMFDVAGAGRLINVSPTA